MQRFKNLPNKWKILSVVLFIVFVSTWGLVGFVIGRKSASAPPVGTFKNENILPEFAEVASPINGILYTKTESENWKTKLPLAVVIENHTDTRPQSGLNKADVIYEALAEGGITRFLVIFLSEDSRIGPVRSNRPYFLDWVSEYGAGYSHVGGSPQAQQLVKSYKIKDLDQFFIGFPTYERVSNRNAPHNVYTTTTRLRSIASSRGYKGPVKISSWLFTDLEAVESERGKKFILDLGFLGTFGYDVRWVYDRKPNSYKRFIGGAKHTDAEDGKQITAKTVVVQYASVSPDSSGHGRVKIQTIGGGKVQVFKNGVVVSGTWRKKSRTDRTRFLDSSGKEISLNRGKIWIEVVPSGSQVSISK